jgi:tyrosyl-tRNA synthetase
VIVGKLAAKFDCKFLCAGGGTTKVGDPSGKDESRQLLSEEQINENIDSLTKASSSPLLFFSLFSFLFSLLFSYAVLLCIILF